MARPRAAEPRTVTVATRLTRAEAAWVDSVRGRLTRGEWLRLMMLRERKSK
jgi:hypothetical protein